MTKLFAVALGVAAVAAPMLAAPALAQQTDRVLVLYGNDKCPTNASGEQIVVCSRLPESERYRIPKELRSPVLITPENQSWAAKANDTLDAGAATGTGSCSTVGPGGQTGCFVQRARKYKRQQQVDAVEAAVPEK